jgi:2-desacetyl-2-hydroxyethyl bacteriochlorophyllide A dehydrogenase
VTITTPAPARQPVGWPVGRMPAIQITGPRAYALADVAIPSPAPGELLAEVDFIGLCGTDLELWHGTATYLRDGRSGYPHVPGHEWTGHVVALAGDVDHLALGDRVVGQTMISCGTCGACQRGRRNLCQRLQETGLYGRTGAAARYVAVPAHAASRLPTEIEAVSAPLIEPAVTVYAALDRVRCTVADVVLVVGCGTIGLLAVTIARILGATVDAVDPSPALREQAERLGARHSYAPHEAPQAAYDVTVEAAGVPDGVRAAVAAAAPGGRVAAVGVCGDPVADFPAGRLVLEGIELHGIRHGLDFYSRTIDLARRGLLDLTSLVGDVLPITELDVAIGRLERRDLRLPKLILHTKGLR